MGSTLTRTIAALSFLLLIPPGNAADGMDRMIGGLDHPLSVARQHAAQRIAEAGDAGGAAIPALIRTLADVDKDVRRAAVLALAAVGRGSEEAVGGLILALNDDDWVVRRQAALSFEGLQPTASIAVPSIRNVLKSESSDVRTSAALALSGLAPDSRQALPELISALGAEDWQLRAAAAHAIGALGADAQDALPALATALRDRDWGVAEQVVEALTRIGKPAIPVLIAALEDPAVPVRWGSSRALGRIGSAAFEAIPALAGALDDPSVQVRWATARSLWTIGAAASEATPALVQALSDKDWVVRWSAARALGAVAHDSHIDATVSSLAVALRDSDSRVCEAAAFALEQMGSTAISALPALSKAATWSGVSGADDTPVCQVIDVGPAIEEVLMETGWTVRWASVRALGVVGAGRQDALSPLTTAMLDEEWQVRGVATLAIGQFGEETPAATVMAVVQNLKDEHPAVRNAAAVALGEIGPPARARIAELRAAESDEDSAVRESAGRSIGKVLGLEQGEPE